MKTILDLNNIEARKFFLKEESYFNFDLPKYFKFQNLLDKLSAKIENRNDNQFYKTFNKPNGKLKPIYPSEYENVNCKIFSNKDGKFAWRPFQLVNPAMYVYLVHKITKEKAWKTILNRFKEFRNNKNIKCVSLPLISESDLSDKATIVSRWWHEIEQKSIELALEYKYLLHTDITDCYGSIYTHSISWALHTKPIAKEKRNDLSLIGNVIDRDIQGISFGQTNGIPQGSVLMDFISEIVLGYADLLLSEKLNSLNVADYKIIRFRDDYRVFTNNPQKAELILKILTEILIELNMRLHSQKTFISENVVKGSIKPDKLYWNLSKRRTNFLQNHLLLIHELSEKFPNSGSLNKSLTKFYNRIYKYEKIEDNVNVLISILADIMFKNPRVYPIASAILSKLIAFSDSKAERNIILDKIMKRFEQIPNTGHLHIWLQRLTIVFDRERNYPEPLCNKVNEQLNKLWNVDWLNSEIQSIILSEKIIDEKIISDLKPIIEPKEVQLFEIKSDYNY